MYAKTIRSVSFPVAWQSAVEFVSKSPEKITFGGGKEIKHAVDSQCSIILDEHAVQDILNHITHPSDPFATPLKLKEYIAEYTDEYDASRFDYTYHEILKGGARGFYKDRPTCYKGEPALQRTPFNQIEALRVGLEKQCKERLSSNRNVAVLWNPVVHTYSNKAQPCWNEVMVRWINDGKAQIYNHFRSHDLGAAWEGNMVAITEFLNREVIKPCECEIVEIVETNFSLHCYNYDLPAMKNIKKLQVNPALQGLQNKYDRIDSPTIFDEYFNNKGL